jgi:hypothetical protein
MIQDFFGKLLEIRCFSLIEYHLVKCMAMDRRCGGFMMILVFYGTRFTCMCNRQLFMMVMRYQAVPQKNREAEQKYLSDLFPAGQHLRIVKREYI